jgi:hypothetical protein
MSAANSTNKNKPKPRLSDHHPLCWDGVAPQNQFSHPNHPKIIQIIQ